MLKITAEKSYQIKNHLQTKKIEKIFVNNASALENYRKFLGPVFEASTYKLEEKGSDIEIVGDLAIVRKRTVVYLTFKKIAQK